MDNYSIVPYGTKFTTILAFSGKKQAGKNTCCDLVKKIFLRELYGTGFTGEFIVDGTKNIPIIRNYSFAYWLKFICTKVLGLTEAQVNGTDEEKNSLTHLRWRDMPGIFYGEDINGTPNKFSYNMTAREVMQHWGSEIFRVAYPNVWVDSTIRQIQDDQPIIATISDARFINEVEAVKNIGGKVIRLLRNSHIESSHQSEIDLDGYKNWDYVIDNREFTLEQLENAVEDMMREMKII